ncbi:MAG TPA: glycine cleavage T C-terminal barrel domain-containing protein [Vicinamibacterales bacterium]|nr:glycine cleavage T C-terminal barrel domain-containing protein [Vicinamibacterales bacterium]
MIQDAAFIDRSEARGRIAITGADRRSYLQGLLTNDVASLEPGLGCYAAYLTAQGRMIADAYVYELGDLMLLSVARAVKDTVLAKFDQFIFSEDVQLGDVTDTFAQIAVVGPRAASALAGVLSASASLDALPEHGSTRTATAGGAAAIVIRIADAGADGFDVYVERANAGSLIASLNAAGVRALDPAAADALRIEAGIPLFGRDMDEETIPLEAGIESRAISFTKGCYVGQEVIIRVMHRGHGRVARRLVGLRIAGDRVPADRAAIRSGDREIGYVTSAAFSPPQHAAIALGYVHRDFVEPGTSVTIDGAAAEVVRLPITSESAPHPRAETPA